MRSTESKCSVASIDLAYREFDSALQTARGSNSAETPAAIIALIKLAITHGAPIYNDGSRLGGALFYSHAARLLLELLSWSPALSEISQILKTASPLDPLTLENANRVAWGLRRAFDTILANLSGVDGVTIPVREITSERAFSLTISSIYFNTIICMPSERTYRKIQVFIACPGDVKDEKDRLLKVIETLRFDADAHGFFVEPMR